MADEKLVKMGILGAIVIGIIGAILLVILLPMSFSYLDFYEVSPKDSYIIKILYIKFLKKIKIILVWIRSTSNYGKCRYKEGLRRWSTLHWSGL